MLTTIILEPVAGSAKIITLDSMFQELKEYGHVLDSDDLPPRRWESDGKMHEKVAGTWRVVGEKDPKSHDLHIIATKEQVDNLKSIPVKNEAKWETRNELKKIYKALPDGKNKSDGRKVKFVGDTFGKIWGHGNDELKKIVPQLKDIFDESIPIYNSNYRSNELRPDGSAHKTHDNYEGYHAYLAKIKDGTDDYYVRFTIEGLKGEKSTDQMHDVFVSDVDLYKEKAESWRNPPDHNRETTNQSASDKILAEFFDKVNSKNHTKDKNYYSTLDGLMQLMKGA